MNGLPSDNLLIEPPYDVGFTYALRRGAGKATISEETAHVLHGCGVPIRHMESDLGAPLRSLDLTTLHTKNPKLSKKARQMLGL